MYHILRPFSAAGPRLRVGELHTVVNASFPQCTPWREAPLVEEIDATGVQFLDPAELRAGSTNLTPTFWLSRATPFSPTRLPAPWSFSLKTQLQVSTQGPRSSKRHEQAHGYSAKK